MIPLLEPYISRCDPYLDLSKANQYDLTIQFALGGFSFVVSDATTHEPLMLEDYKSADWHTEDKLLDGLRQTMEQKTLSALSFHKVLIAYEGSNNIFVPTDLFTPDEASTYLHFLHHRDGNASTRADKMRNIDAYNIYPMTRHIADRIERLWDNVNIKHHSSLLVDTLAEKEINNETTLFVYTKERNFDLAVMQERNMLFFNTFKFNSKDDFLYFIANAMEQLHLDMRHTPVVFMGSIMPNSEVVSVCEHYIGRLSFASCKTEVPLLKGLPYHSYYIILNQ